MASYDDFKGSYPGASPIGQPESVILYEGHIQRVLGEGSGRDEYFVQRENRIKVGDWIELYDDAAFEYDALGGVPIAKKLASTGSVYAGIVEYIEPNNRIPSDDNEITSLATLMANDCQYLRRARVVFPGLIGTRNVICKVAQSGTTLPVADPTKIVFDVSENQFASAASGGAGLVPFHHVTASGSAAVKGRVLVGVGMVPLVVV